MSEWFLEGFEGIRSCEKITLQVDYARTGNVDKGAAGSPWPFGAIDAYS